MNKFDKLTEAYLKVVNEMDLKLPKITPENVKYLYVNLHDGKSQYITQQDGDYMKEGIKSVDSRYIGGKQGARIWMSKDWIIIDLVD
jgi:hypothetical protein